MTPGRIDKIDVFLLRPGCPPEHLREFVRTITSRDEIDEVLEAFDRVGRDEGRLGENSPGIPVDGGVVFEYRIRHSDGSIRRFIAPGEDLERPG